VTQNPGFAPGFFWRVTAATDGTISSGESFTMKSLIPLALLGLVLTNSARSATPDAVVAADGSGQFRTVRAAIDAAPQITHAGRHWTIFVKAGEYRELVYIQREKRFISLVGEDAERTSITFDLFNDYPAPDGKPIATFRTPTVMLDADDFTIENLTIRNAAGRKGQALAIRVDGDRAVFRRCRFIGWQDTILVNRAGITSQTARSWAQRTSSSAARPRISSAARSGVPAAVTSPRPPRPISNDTGWSFRTAPSAERLRRSEPDRGRPWRDYAQTVFLNCEMSTAVRPEGWHNWEKPHAEKVSRYAEFNSHGPGAGTGRPRPMVPPAQRRGGESLHGRKRPGRERRLESGEITFGTKVADPPKKNQFLDAANAAAPLPPTGSAMPRRMNSVSWEGSLIFTTWLWLESLPM
jgi:pectinesterase